MSDDIEGSWSEPIKGAQVGPWCVDLLEALLDGDIEKGRLHAERLTSVDDPDVILGFGLLAVSMISDLKNGFPQEAAEARLALVRENARRSQGNRSD